MKPEPDTVSVEEPMVKVEHNSTTSEPDSHAIDHSHLSPVDKMSTADGENSNSIRQPIVGLDYVPYGSSVNRPWRNPSEGFN